VDPVITAIRRELAAVITKLHRIDFAKTSDPMIGLGGPSFYMKELVEKMSYIKSEILSRYSVGHESSLWPVNISSLPAPLSDSFQYRVTSIVKFVIRTFVLHVSITRPLGESGKLQLTSDMTELEFALNSFMGGADLGSVGEDYRMLRAIRYKLIYFPVARTDIFQSPPVP
jgi:conserved oligomeric Golgi complex subunit 5